MKKVLCMMMMFILMFFMVMPVFAAEDDYTFNLEYTGTFTKGVQKDMNIVLTGGKSSTPYTNAKIKVSVTGPARPVILARDNQDTQYNLMYLAYPNAGLQINSETNNVTNIQATFPEAGTYKITLSLVNADSSDTVIVTKEFSIQVYEEEDLPENNIIDNAVSDNNIDNNTVNNTLSELPKTGTSVIEYAMYIIAITLIISIVGIYLNKKRMKA